MQRRYKPSHLIRTGKGAGEIVLNIFSNYSCKILIYLKKLLMKKLLSCILLVKALLSIIYFLIAGNFNFILVSLH